MVIYLDVLFLENFIVNMFLLLVTTKLFQHKFKICRLLLASSIGGIYGIVLVIPELEFFAKVPFELLAAYIMIYIVYENNSLKANLKALCIFMCSMILLSGLCFMFAMGKNHYLPVGQFEFKLDNYSVKYVFISVIIIYMASGRLKNYIKDRIAVSSYTYTITFEIQGKQYSFKSFLDTGNELREPATNLPCILIEKDLFPPIKPEEQNIYYIPYNAIGYRGRLKGIRVNDIRIEGDNFLTKSTDAIICPCVEKLSRQNEFNVLLSRGVL